MQKSIKITILIAGRFRPDLKITESSLFFAHPAIAQQKIIYGYGVAICAQRAMGEELIRAYVGTNGPVVCAQPVMNEFFSP